MFTTQTPVRTHDLADGCRQVADCRLAIICPGHATRTYYPNGGLLLPEKMRKTTHAYLQYEGFAGLFRLQPTGKETITCVYMPGSVFGLSAFFDDWWGRMRPGWYVRTLTSVTFCELDPEELLSYVTQDSNRVRFLLKHTARQLHYAMRRVALSARHAPEKGLALLIAVLAENASQQGSAGILISPRFTHQDLADMAGLARPTATYALHDLCRRGLIVRQDKQIFVPNVDRLWELADE